MMSRKRRREEPNVNTEVVGLYEDLANENEEVRLKAAKDLLFALTRERDGQLLSRTIRRLIRGLCSGRKAARLGFSVALTEFLVQWLGPKHSSLQGFNTALPELLDILNEQTNITGNVSGQEVRDHCFGRLFGAEAIIKSRVLFQPAVPIELWYQILNVIFDLAKSKPWLREECGYVICGSLQTLKNTNVDSEYAEACIQILIAANLVKTPEGVAVWITCQRFFPEVALPNGHWHKQDPLDRKTLAVLAKIMREAPVASDTKDSQATNADTGAWRTSLHFAWDVVLKAVIEDDHEWSGQENTKQNFSIFWESVVDDGLFAASSSEERKYWGFRLHQRFWQTMDAPLLPHIVMKNFKRCLVNQLVSRDRYLHRAAEQTLQVMHSRIAKEPELAGYALERLIGMEPGRMLNFDTLTKTKTIEKLISQANALAFKQIIDFFEGCLLRPGGQGEKSASSERQMALDYMISALRSRVISMENDVGHALKKKKEILSVFDILIRFAYFGPESEHIRGGPSNPIPPLSRATIELFKAKITTCLTLLLGKLPNPENFPFEILLMIRDRENREGVTSTLNADEDIKKVLHRACKNLDKLHAKNEAAKGDEKDFLKAFEMLYSLTILQVYNEDADAVDLLGELKGCYETMVKETSIEGRNQGCELLLEVLLSLVSKPSQLFRRVAKQVFGACASQINSNGLGSLLQVLESEENSKGQEAMFDNIDDGIGADELPDIEEVDMDNEDLKQTNGDDTSSEAPDDSGSDVTEESNGSDDELAAFDAKLAQALGTHTATKDFEAGSSKDSSDDDEAMDDDQMEALDGYLESVFKERAKVKSAKTTRKEAKETMVNFKRQVLELLEIYIAKQHSNPLALDLLLPLLILVRKTQTKSIADRACALIREYAKLCKGKNITSLKEEEEEEEEEDDEEDEEDERKEKHTQYLFKLLEAVHEEAANKEGSNAYNSACSQASLLLVKVLAAQEGRKEHLRKVVGIYGATQERFLLEAKSCHVKTGFFTDWLNWCTSARKSG